MIYLIPTPIGNLEDITLRALRLLKESDLILAEDTRVSIKLLKHYGITTSLESFHMYNEHKKTPRVIEQQDGQASADDRQRAGLSRNASTTSLTTTAAVQKVAAMF